MCFWYWVAWYHAVGLQVSMDMLRWMTPPSRSP